MTSDEAKLIICTRGEFLAGLFGSPTPNPKNDASELNRDLRSQVEARLKACKNSGALAFVNFGLVGFPEATYSPVGAIASLKTTDSKSKQAAILDKDAAFWEFKEVRTVDLSHNPKLRSLADSTYMNVGGCWSEVTSFTCSSSDLDRLPSELFNLANLRHVRVDNNQLISFPETFSLSSLESLHASNNHVHCLEYEFFGFKDETFCEKYSCAFASEPQDRSRTESFMGLESDISRFRTSLARSLKVLDMSNNELTILPESFGFVKYLQKLNLSRNSITHLPPTFTLLSNLIDLDLSQNKISDLTAGFEGDWPSLTSLKLCQNKISHLPGSLNFPKLGVLEFSHNSISALNLSALRQCESLAVLNGSNNCIKTISFDGDPGLSSKGRIGVLQRLRILNLSMNDITNLPVFLGKMDALEKLFVEGNPIKQIRPNLLQPANTTQLLKHMQNLAAPPDPSLSAPLKCATLKKSVS